MHPRTAKVTVVFAALAFGGGLPAAVFADDPPAGAGTFSVPFTPLPVLEYQRQTLKAYPANVDLSEATTFYCELPAVLALPEGQTGLLHDGQDRFFVRFLRLSDGELTSAKAKARATLARMIGNAREKGKTPVEEDDLVLLPLERQKVEVYLRGPAVGDLTRLNTEGVGMSQPDIPVGPSDLPAETLEMLEKKPSQFKVVVKVTHLFEQTRRGNEVIVTRTLEQVKDALEQVSGAGEKLAVDRETFDNIRALGGGELNIEYERGVDQSMIQLARDLFQQLEGEAVTLEDLRGDARLVFTVAGLQLEFGPGRYSNLTEKEKVETATSALIDKTYEKVRESLNIEDVKESWKEFVKVTTSMRAKGGAFWGMMKGDAGGSVTYENLDGGTRSRFKELRENAVDR